MTATMVMAEMATAMTMVTAMMPPPLPTAMMLMTMTVAIQGWRLEDGNSTTTMGRLRCDGDGWQQHAERLQVLRHPSKTTINCRQFGEEWCGPVPPIGCQKAQRRRQ
jgi:hypothetical protein